MRLTTPRLLLRSFTEADLARDFAPGPTPAERAVQPFDLRDPTGIRRQIREAIAAEHEEPRTEWDLAVIIADTDRLIGRAGLRLSPHEPREALVWFVSDPSSWNQGFANEALTAVLGACFGQLHLHRVTAECSPVTPAPSACSRRSACGARRTSSRTRTRVAAGWTPPSTPCWSASGRPARSGADSPHFIEKSHHSPPSSAPMVPMSASTSGVRDGGSTSGSSGASGSGGRNTVTGGAVESPGRNSSVGAGSGGVKAGGVTAGSGSAGRSGSVVSAPSARSCPGRRVTSGTSRITGKGEVCFRWSGTAWPYGMVRLGGVSSGAGSAPCVCAKGL